ncbi:hypothetical protein AAXB25_23970 [Paenibacillus lautus]|uniref:hypothetical protein n=1 Tax=Paenibacillus lautus TaxID=1401 RepID=UPI003D27E546
MNRKNVGLLLSIILIICTPLLINEFIVNSDFYSKASNDSWVSFLGSYLGGIFGGIATLTAVVITLKETNKQNIKPFLVIDFNDIPEKLYRPEEYSSINKLDMIANFYQVPSIIELFDLKIINTGRGYAKDVKVLFSINREDTLLTDRNIAWLFETPKIEKVKITSEYFIQNHEFSYIGSEGEFKWLPVNILMNGIIMSSFWNLDNNVFWNKEEFKRTELLVEQRLEKGPFAIPSLDIYIEYSDFDNNIYQAFYRLSFDIVYKMIGDHTLVKAKLEFPESNKRKYKLVKQERDKRERRSKVKQFKRLIMEIRQKRMNKKKELWVNRIFEFGIALGLDEFSSKKISTDEAFERYFYLCYEKNKVTLEHFIIILSYLFLNISEKKVSLFRKKNLVKIAKLRAELIELLGRGFVKRNQEDYQKENYNNIIQIIKDEKKIFNEYFKLYEVDSAEKEVIIQVYSDSGISTQVNIGNEDLITELGFFRTGNTYRLIGESESKLIQSAMKNNNDNIEIGYFDERGYVFGESKSEWSCVYLR